MQLNFPSQALKEKLMQVRLKQLGECRLSEEFIKGQEVIFLFDDMWASFYLRFDGSIIVRDWDFDTNTDKWYEENDNQITGILIMAARKLSVPDLLELLPQKPKDGKTCVSCRGDRQLHLEKYPQLFSLCPGCEGLGWTS